MRVTDFMNEDLTPQKIKVVTRLGFLIGFLMGPFVVYLLNYGYVIF